MCTEFLLAIIYFITIFLVNYFLFRLVKNYFTTIFSLVKLKVLFKAFKKSTNNLVFSFLSLLKKERKNVSLLGKLQKFSKTKDILIIGNTYKYLGSKVKNEISKENKLYFFDLLASHYLFLTDNK